MFNIWGKCAPLTINKANCLLGVSLHTYIHTYIYTEYIMLSRYRTQKELPRNASIKSSLRGTNHLQQTLRPTLKDTIPGRTSAIGAAWYPTSIPKGRFIPNMTPNNSPTRTAYQVKIGDMIIDVPTQDRCWEFRVRYACRCPVVERSLGVVRDKVIRVKRHNHRVPCALLRCIIGSETHVLPERCTRCEQYLATLGNNRVTGG